MNEVFLTEYEKVIAPFVARAMDADPKKRGSVMNMITPFLLPFCLDPVKNPVISQFGDVEITAAKIDLARGLAIKFVAGRDKESYMLVKNVCAAAKEAPKGEKIAAAKEEFDDLAKPMIEKMFQEFYEQFLKTLLGDDEDQAIILLNYLEKYTKC